MTELVKYVRYYVFGFSILLAIALFVYIWMTVPSESLRVIKLTRLYAFSALIYLYLALFISPWFSLFPNFPYRGLMVKARRALGNSAFLFALLHASFAFFGQLGGFGGLFFLSSKYLIAISLSFTALLILALMASTSFDFMVNRLGRRWKMIHRLVYLAAIYVIIHALMLGTHFSDLNDLIPQISFALLTLLLLLEAIRLDKYFTSRYQFTPRLGLSVVVVAILLTGSYFYLLLPKTGTTSLGIHAQHQQLAAQNQQTQTVSNIPGLSGDRTKRYSVNFTTTGDLVPNSEVRLTFKVTDASNGNPVNLYTINYEKIAHLIVIDDKLQYFNHIHPDQSEAEFSIITQFPHDGLYRLYLDFQPTGAIEQQFASTLAIGAGASTGQITPDTSATKQFGDYEVTLSSQMPLSASRLSLGTQTIQFTVKKEGQEVTNLKPYLGAFGHMVMIKTDTYDYIHVHPTNFTSPKPEDTSGPEVSFSPIGIYGPIKPGTYRVFTQLNPDSQLFTANFTVSVN
jgi:DMSO/TMAO reductase YedYZ heme-binding membrane subunit